MSIPEVSLRTPAWSKKALRRLGEAIRDDAEPPEEYLDVIAWYDELALEVREHIRAIDWRQLLPDLGLPELSSRAKTIDTLRDKLQRDRSTPLSNIQDVAGVRFEAEMTLAEQDAVVAALVAEFDGCVDSVKDLRVDHHSGYRAVHVWLRPPAGHVEVQVRTHIQGAWANMYEALADFAGREIRYGKPPHNAALAPLVEEMQQLSLGRGRLLEDMRLEIASIEGDLRKVPPLPEVAAVTEDGRLMTGRLRKLLDRMELLKDRQVRAEAAYTEELARLETEFRAARGEVAGHV